MYSCGPLHMDQQRQDNQLEPTYSSSVLIWDVTWKTCQKQWTIEKGGEKWSEISVRMTRHDDDDGWYTIKPNQIKPNQIIFNMYKEVLALNDPQWLTYHKTPTKLNHIYLIYMYKQNSKYNNSQRLICHKVQPNQTKSSI